MQQDQSNDEEPEREEPQADLKPIIKIYDAATKVLKLGERWLLTEPEGWLVPSEFDLDPASEMFFTFRDTFKDELLDYRRFLMTEDMQRLTSRCRPLSSVLKYLDCVCREIHTNAFDPPMGVPSVGVIKTNIETLGIARSILGEVLDDLESEENPTIRPLWDREAKQLWYGEVLCREYRKEAPEQFQILGLFQAREWTRTVPSPWRDEKKMRDTVLHLNDKHTPESLVRFEVFNRKPAWFRFRPRSESRQLR
jgi:hypothetical protein